MTTAMPSRVWPMVIFLAVAAGGGLPPAVSTCGAAAGPPPVFLAPVDGASIPAGRVLVIGKAGKGVSRVDVDVNGKGKQAIAVTRGGFSAHVTLAAGKNVIRASAGKAAATVTVSAADRMPPGKATYRYHAVAEKCPECHGPGGKGFAVAPPRDTLCYRCHKRMDGKRLVHGPMGSGDCTACHDPHGSGNKSLTVARHESLCITCHDQKSSEAHFGKSRGKACTVCHDPHSSDKPFLQK